MIYFGTSLLFVIILNKFHYSYLTREKELLLVRYSIERTHSYLYLFFVILVEFSFKKNNTLIE